VKGKTGHSLFVLWFVVCLFVLLWWTHNFCVHLNPSALKALHGTAPHGLQQPITVRFSRQDAPPRNMSGGGGSGACSVGMGWRVIIWDELCVCVW
jgi:hypothetical protein